MVELVIAPIAESVASSVLTESDRQFIGKFSSAKRRSELSSWRVALRSRLRELGLDELSRRDICYSAVGAPYILGSELYISVSHSARSVAIVISDEPCAVDVEALDRDFERVARRYVSESERALMAEVSSDKAIATHLLPLLWSAKEVLYKISGGEGYDLCNDLSVSEIDVENAIVYGCVRPIQKEYKLRYILNETEIILYT